MDGADRACSENEAAFLEKLNEGIAKGTAWERITELINLENSRESSTSGSVDVAGGVYVWSRTELTPLRVQDDPAFGPWRLGPRPDEGDPVGVETRG